MLNLQQCLHDLIMKGTKLHVFCYCVQPWCVHFPPSKLIQTQRSIRKPHNAVQTRALVPNVQKYCTHLCGIFNNFLDKYVCLICLLHAMESVPNGKAVLDSGFTQKQKKAKKKSVGKRCKLCRILDYKRGDLTSYAQTRSHKDQGQRIT